METAFSTETVVTQGIEMPVASIGPKGKPAEKTFVILPGISVKQVTPFIKAVGAQYRVFPEGGYRLYLFDRRANMPEGYTVTDMAEDTAAVMERLGIEKADVFGASQGGMIAAALAISHPALVDHLMLGSTSLKHSENSDAQFRRWIGLAQQREEKELLTVSGRAMYSPETWAAYGEGIVNAGAGLTEEEYTRFIRTAAALLSVDLLEKVRTVCCKTLVLASRGDKVFSVRDSEQIAEAIGCESYFYGTEYGHAVYDEAPDYAARLFEFCCR